MTAIDLVGCDTQALFGDPAQHVGGEHAVAATQQHPRRDVRKRPERGSSLTNTMRSSARARESRGCGEGTGAEWLSDFR